MTACKYNKGAYIEHIGSRNGDMEGSIIGSATAISGRIGRIKYRQVGSYFREP